MSIRTNPMKAVPSLQRRLTTVKSKENPNIAEKLENLMSELQSIKGLFSTVKRNEEELLDTLKLVDDLFRDFKPPKIIEITNRLLQSDNAIKANREKGTDEPSSSQEAQENKSLEKDVAIDKMLESLKSELDKMKEKFSIVKKNELELREKLKNVEDLVQNFKEKSFTEHFNPAGDANQSQTSGEKLVDQLKATGIDKPPSSQETTQEKKSEEEDVPIDEKLDSLKSEIDITKAKFSAVKKNEEVLDMLRATKDLLQNFNAKGSAEIVEPAQDSKENDTKVVDKPSPSQKAQDEERVEEDVSSQKAQDKESVEENVSIDEMFESLKFELDNMKTKFSTVKQNEELHNTLRAVEDLLRNFNERILAEIVNPVADTNKSETKGLELQNQKSREELVGLQKASDKPSPSQEAPDNKVVEKDEPIDEKFERLKSEIDNMKAKFSSSKKNELWNMVSAQREDLLQISNAKSLDENVKHKGSKEELVDSVVKAIHKRIKDSTKKLGVSQSEEVDDSSSQAKASKPVQHPTLFSLSENNEVKNLVLKRFQASYDALNLHSKLCCLSLSVFPENVVIRKRHIIYWWIGEGFVKYTKEKTAEEEGEDVFNELLNSYLIVPHGNSKCPIVNKFKISPWILDMLVSSVLLGENNQPFEKFSQVKTSSHNNSRAYLVLDQKKVKISGEFGDKFDRWRSVFNVGASYLSVEPQWMTKMKKMVVLQLGRWHESPSYHIEVDSINFMKDLKGQKHLKYLSLRGISRITELPPSIGQLVSLQILDLKACHNLETLPVEIALLKKLTHLDASQCYLLESMPKGIEKLSELQVLKGFVVGNSNKSPRISDLAKLKKLKRLSIHIGSEAVVQAEDFDSLNDLEEVKCLKISWGVSSNSSYTDKVINIILPPGLEKLDLECFPREEINVSMFRTSELRKLYIKGGKLKNLNPFYKFFKVEILRLMYLKDVEVNPKYLPQRFPSLKYAEGKKVSKQSFEWPNSVEDQVIKC